MKYILTEKEYDELRYGHDKRIGAARKKLQDLCTLAAKHVPSKYGPGAWGCILADDRQTTYCDGCPVQHVCPYDGKRWSK